MKSRLSTILHSPYFILLLLVLAANWQLVLLQQGMEWDMMNFWMPWRHYLSECYNNGIVPVWNPYAQSGYPVHGDLQGPPYSPEAILVSMLFGQNIYVLNYCFVFYLYVAAVALYKLAFFFTQKKEVSVLAGIIYSLSGFNVAHGHYFYIVVSVALVPLIFYYFFRILKEGGHLNSLKLAVIIFWHITTGNPSFLIIAGYLMLLIYLCYVIWKIRGKETAAIFDSLKVFSLTLLLALAMALPVIYNAMHIIPLTTRKDGLDLAYAGDESFYFQNFIAFLIPLITITNVDLTGYEQELWSPYLGAFTILFFLGGLTLKKDFFTRMLLLTGLLGLLIALGLQWPVYPFLHKHLPLFNVFRMPNLSMLFFQIAVLVIAAKFLSDEQRVARLFGRKTVWFFGLLWMAALAVMHYVAVAHGQGGDSGLFANYENLRQWIYAASPAQVTLFHTLLFGLVLAFLLLFNFTLRRKLTVLLLVTVFDVFVNYQLGGVARIFSAEPAPAMNAYFARFPKGFAPPAPMALARVSNISKEWKGYWLNTSIFNKQPDFPNSNNFELTSYLDLLLKRPRLAANIFRNSYAWFADSVVTRETYTDSLLASSKSVATLAQADRQAMHATSYNNGGNKIHCTKFFPQQQAYSLTLESPALFVISQNFTPLWQYRVNGKPYKPFAVDGTFPAFALPSGSWEISARYETPGLGYMLLFSLALFTACVFVIMYASLAPGTLKISSLALVVLIFGFCLGKFLLADPEKKKRDVAAALAGQSGSRVINNTSMEIPGALQTNFVLNEDVMQLAAVADTSRSDRLDVLCYDRYFSPEAELLLAHAYGEQTDTRRFSHGARIFTFRRNPALLLLDTTLTPDNNIDSKNPYSSGIQLDSLRAASLRKGDLLVISAAMSAPAFDFPGVSLELHYSGMPGVLYKYGNASAITGPRHVSPGIVYRLEQEAVLKKLLCYVWNPSPQTARISRLRMRIYRR
jgi:hypothetical protein